MKCKMRTHVFKLLFTMLCIAFVPKLIVGENTNVTNSSKNGNSTVLITNVQTKTVSPRDLPNVQLQEVAKKEKSSQEKVEILNNTSSKVKSRKTTPTDIVKKPIELEKISKKQNLTQINNEQVTVKTVAEGVVLKIPTNNDTNIKLVQEKTQNPIQNTNETKVDTKMANTTQIQSSTKAINNSSSTTTTTVSTTTKVTTTTTTTTTTSTTTTAAPIPKKPLSTYGLEDLSEADIEAAAAAAQQASSKFPQPEPAVPVREFPNAEPSQELMYHSNRNYFVPVLTIMFTIPLAMGILITVYRRFRDYWSTRHYRRMDFLVDGMYNE